MELLPTEALESIAEVMTFGAKKYGDHNWRNGLDWTRLVGSSMRHLSSWVGGEELDPESGLSHIAHLGANVLMLMTSIKLRLGKDTRWKK